jgi:transcription antitermination factor NusG
MGQEWRSLRESSIFPENRGSQSVGEEQWYAVVVRGRREFLVASLLAEKGFDPFLPAQTQIHHWSDRIKRVEAPLFPGYVFCRFALSVRLLILNTHGVRGIVGAGPAPFPVDSGEIAALQAIVRSGLGTEPWPFLRSGQPVRIERGPLRGLEGVVICVSGQHRLVVNVTLLQRSVAAQIDPEWVSPVAMFVAGA